MRNQIKKDKDFPFTLQDADARDELGGVGLMHNGAAALEGAPALVERLAAAGKKLGILSNSSKRKEWTMRELPKLGFSADVFVAAAVTTSGEEAWHALGAHWRGKVCVWLSKRDGDGVTDYLEGNPNPN